MILDLIYFSRNPNQIPCIRHNLVLSDDYDFELNILMLKKPPEEQNTL